MNYNAPNSIQKQFLNHLLFEFYNGNSEHKEEKLEQKEEEKQEHKEEKLEQKEEEKLEHEEEKQEHKEEKKQEHKEEEKQEHKEEEKQEHKEEKKQEHKQTTSTSTSTSTRIIPNMKIIKNTNRRYKKPRKRCKTKYSIFVLFFMYVLCLEICIYLFEFFVNVFNVFFNSV